MAGLVPDDGLGVMRQVFVWTLKVCPYGLKHAGTMSDRERSSINRTHRCREGRGSEEGQR